MSSVKEVVGSLKEPHRREPIAWLVAVLGSASGWINGYFSSQQSELSLKQWELGLKTIISLCNPS